MEHITVYVLLQWVLGPTYSAHQRDMLSVARNWTLTNMDPSAYSFDLHLDTPNVQPKTETDTVTTTPNSCRPPKFMGRVVHNI